MHLIVLAVFVALHPEVVENEQADGRRQVTVMAAGIDRGDKFRQGQVARDSDFFQPLPERILKTDACFMPGNDD